MGGTKEENKNKRDRGRSSASQNVKGDLRFAPTQQADEKLVRRAMEGDPDAVEQVIRLYYQDILYFSMKKVGAQDGADVAQHAITHIINDIDKLQDPAKFKSWMMSLVYYNCVDHIRSLYKNEKKIVADGETYDYIPDESPDINPEEVVVAEEDRKTILAIIDTMPENYADCIRLRYYDGMSNPEIAEVLGVDEKKVRNDMHRSHTLLKKKLEQFTSKTFATARMGAVPALGPIFASEKAELVTPELATQLFDVAKADIAVKYGSTTAAQAATVAAKTGLSAAKIAGISGAIVTAVAAVATVVTLSLPPAEVPATPEPQPQPTEAIVPVEEASINTIADMIGVDEAANLTAFEAGTTDAQQWQAFLDRIGAQEALAGYEPDSTYRVYVLEKQDKQLMLAERQNNTNGAIQVVSQFGYIQELPLMIEVSLMFP